MNHGLLDMTRIDKANLTLKFDDPETLERAVKTYGFLRAWESIEKRVFGDKYNREGNYDPSSKEFQEFVDTVEEFFDS